MLFRRSGKTHPSQLTEADVFTFCQSGRANNTNRARIAACRVFLRWCVKHDLTDLDLEEDLSQLRKRYPATYGKAQGQYPPRWLSQTEAFGALLDACKDGTWTGSRDQLLMRLGLMGLRCSEIAALRWDAVQPDGTLKWMGKGHRPRTVKPGPTFADMLSRWRRAYEKELGRPVRGTDPLLCRSVTGPNNRGRLHWGEPIATSRAIRYRVEMRAQQAGLGHVAPHDLRRSAAGIMQRTRSADGGHIFNLTDIQKVLGHADPAVTQRCYIDQLDTEALDRAAVVLD